MERIIESLISQYPCLGKRIRAVARWIPQPVDADWVEDASDEEIDERVECEIAFNVLLSLDFRPSGEQWVSPGGATMHTHAALELADEFEGLADEFIGPVRQP